MNDVGQIADDLVAQTCQRLADGLQDGAAVGVVALQDAAPQKSGRMKSAVSAAVDPDNLSIEFSIDDPAAVFLEVGTKHEPAHPTFRPALQSALPVIANAIEKASS